MPHLLDALQLTAYTSAPLYLGWLIGNNHCPGHANFYLCLYGPVALESIGGFLSGLRGAPYHGNTIARLVSETPEDDQISFESLGEACKGAAFGASGGFALSMTAYGSALTLGELVNRLF